MNMKKMLVVAVAGTLVAGCSSGVSGGKGVVSFKDAAKIRSWDAWDDHKAQAAVTNVLQREKPCVTWERLNGLDFGLKEIGRLTTRTSSKIKGSKWSVGCETLDRDYADWDSYKALIPMLGVKHARFFSGWAKTEQEKGVYDFTWLDPQIRECAAMDVKPWICISYGNPVWGSDFRLGMRVKQVTGNPAAFDAWIRYTKALVARYKDVVDEWEVWNEPFDQAEEYAEMFYRTAKAIREVQPEAKIFCTAITLNWDMTKNDYAVVLEKLKKENALGLASRFIYHPYDENPDSCYDWRADALRKFVKTYDSRFDILQGEVGCPGQLEFAHAMNSIEWTEYSQAKWDLRRAIGDAVRDIPSNVFTMTDLQYTFMLQSYGLVRSNTLKEFVYRRPKWYAMRNVYALFDDDTNPVGVRTDLPARIEKRADPRDAAKRVLTRASFTRFGRPLHLFWYSNERPSNRLEFDRVTLTVPGVLADPVWVDMITGRIAAIDPKNVRIEKDETVLTDVPMWDSPVLIADRAAVGGTSLAAKACLADDRVPFADPYILFHEGTYYAYGTCRCNDGIGVATSKDLRTWNLFVGAATNGLALAKGDAFGTCNFWAPEVYCRGTNFVMYYSADQKVCAAVAKSPLGPFVNASRTPIIADRAGIDNSLFEDSDGSLKMFYVLFDGGNVVWATDMERDALHERRGRRRFVLRASQPWERKGKANVAEGPFVIKENGIYYLTYSCNDYRNCDYAVGVATATSPDGPWTKRPEPVLCRFKGLCGTGHHSFFKDAAGKWRIVFHAHDSAARVHPRHMYVADVSFVRDAAGQPTLAIGGELITCRFE